MSNLNFQSDCDWTTASEESELDSSSASSASDNDESDETDFEGFALRETGRSFFEDFTKLQKAQDFLKHKPISCDDDKLMNCQCKHCWVWKLHAWAEQEEIDETHNENRNYRNKAKSKEHIPKKRKFLDRMELPLFCSETFQGPIDPTAYYLDELNSKLELTLVFLQDARRCLHRTTTSVIEWFYKWAVLDHRRVSPKDEQSKI